MIEPTSTDLGRAVIYTGNRYPGGKPEEGVVTSFNEHSVFVRYGVDRGSKATARADLDWVTPTVATEPKGWRVSWTAMLPDPSPVPAYIDLPTQALAQRVAELAR
jgi:hypothetical protein